MNSSSYLISSFRAKLEKMPSIPEEPEVLESEVERRTMPDFITPLRDVEVVEGKEAVLKCKVSGLPYPTIAWYHNGKKIDSTDDRKMTQCKCTCGDLPGTPSSSLSSSSLVYSGRWGKVHWFLEDTFMQSVMDSQHGSELNLGYLIVKQVTYCSHCWW